MAQAPNCSLKYFNSFDLAIWPRKTSGRSLGIFSGIRKGTLKINSFAQNITKTKRFEAFWSRKSDPKTQKHKEVKGF